MRNRKAILAVVAGSMAVALVALNSVAALQPMGGKARTQLKDVSVKNVHSQGLHSSAPIIETTGFEVPDWDAYNPNAICNSGTNAGLACTTGADCPGGTCDVDNFMCGAAYRGFCKATPIAGSCTGNPAADVNCCIGAPNALNSWFVSGSSQHCREPHIEIAHPFTGSQHMRFVRDPLGGNPAGCVSQGTACREGAFTPDMGPAQVVGPSTIEWDIAGDTGFGASMEYFTVGADGGAGTILYFYNAGFIYIYDAPTGNLVNAGPWIYDGAYRHFKIDRQTCNNVLNYYYDGNLIFSTTSAGDGTQTVERAIMQTDNGPGNFDVDNYSVQRGPVCPAVCDNGTLEPGEECEQGIPNGCPAGRCIPAGQPGECTCSPICTLNNPCVLHNGPNGPFAAPCDPSFACIFVYSATTESVAIDTCGSNADTQIFYWGSVSDPNDAGSSNDDCENTDQFGAGSDPNASCYNNPTNFESCTCHDNPAAGDNQFLAQIGANGGLAPLGTIINVNIEKKAACGQAVLGSCCIDNGPAVGCTDDIPQAACTGSFSTQKCVDRAPCVCVPNCTGRVCGDDGCGGSCGTCNDNNGCTDDSCSAAGQCVFTNNSAPCDDGSACTSNDTCSGGTCGGTAVNCNDNNPCTTDGCAPASGCTHTNNSNACDDGNPCTLNDVCGGGSCAGTPNTCDDGVDCTVDSCNSADGSCSHDQSGCFTPIPTVSQWGIAVMALLLLIGAKIYFTRRQSTTA